MASRECASNTVAIPSLMTNESLRSLQGKRNSNCGSSFFRGWFRGGGGPSTASPGLHRVDSQVQAPRWRRRRPCRPIYSASTGGARYDLSLPPLSSLSQLANGEKNADNFFFFFSSGRPQAGASPGRGHDGTSPGAPLRESLKQTKTSLQGRLTDVHCSLLDPSLSVVGGAGAEVGIPPAGRRAGPGALWGEPSSLSLSLDERKRN